ncbi:GNAT family N-acetyltransferase [Candidatus Poribacteria bacterium]|nr:GNAT family N-acetyltransferase [Candidatus Poribacteria bacterium]
MQKLKPEQYEILADSLENQPTTVIPTSRLRTSMCSAYTYGVSPDFHAVVIFDSFCPDEPMGFGHDVNAIWNLLKYKQGWSCIGVDEVHAESLGNLINRTTNSSIQYYGDIYHTLEKPAKYLHNKCVRLLTLNDKERISKAPKEIQGNGYLTIDSMLIDGIVAGAIVDNSLVTIAHIYAETDLYADIGVFTQEHYRGSGFATAAASLVAREIQAKGKIPVWSCGEDNYASLKIAKKIGFTKVDRRTYVIPETIIQ